MSLLTIKHVEKSGHESIQQAHSISYHPKGVDGREPKDKPCLEAFGCTGIGGPVDEHGWCCYANGIVYIMNDSGSTVGKYDLD